MTERWEEEGVSESHWKDKGKPCNTVGKVIAPLDVGLNLVEKNKEKSTLSRNQFQLQTETGYSWIYYHKMTLF